MSLFRKNFRSLSVNYFLKCKTDWLFTEESQAFSYAYQRNMDRNQETSNTTVLQLVDGFEALMASMDRLMARNAYLEKEINEYRAEVRPLRFNRVDSS